MKRLIIILFIFLSVCALNAQTVRVFNSDIKINNAILTGSTSGTVTISAPAEGGNVDIVFPASTGTLSTIEEAIDISSIAFVKADTITKLATKTDLLNVSGGGGGVTGKFFYLSGITGETTGLPNGGDSLVIHTNFIGKKVTVFREGQLQQRHANNTGTDGYWFDEPGGKLTFKPVFGDGEQLEIWSTNTILWEALIPEGGGGGGGSPPETPILDLTLAYYKMDEPSGTVMYDAHGTLNGTLNGSMAPATGILGYGHSFDGDLDNTTIPYSATLVPTDSMAISVWVKPSSLPSSKGHYGYVYVQRLSTTPWRTLGILIDTDNTIWSFFIDANGVEYWSNYATPVSVGTWYHIVAVCRGDGENTELWVNGVLRDTSGPFDGTIKAGNSYTSIGNGSENGSTGLGAVIDELGIFEGLGSTQIIEIYNSGTGKTYPFN